MASSIIALLDYWMFIRSPSECSNSSSTLDGHQSDEHDKGISARDVRHPKQTWREIRSYSSRICELRQYSEVGKAIVAVADIVVEGKAAGTWE